MSNDGKSERFQKADFVTFLIIIALLIPMVGLIYPVAERNGESVKNITFREKTVWCSLYTWWGIPGGPAGMYGLDAFQMDKQSEWGTSFSSGNNIAYVNGTITGDLQTQDSLAMNLSGKIPINTRTYFELNISSSAPHKGNVSLIIISNGVKYSTILLNQSYSSNEYQVINKVFPIHFTEEGASTMGNNIVVIQTVSEMGSYNLSVDYLQTSRWKHYDEDYHTYEGEDGYWFNDPPVHIATAHRAFYDGNPWPEIESYGMYNHSKWNEVKVEDAVQYGLYDSLDPLVIRSQLRLMEKAGIDVVQVMHPWSLDIFTMIIDIAKSINSNLTFFLYGSSNLAYVKNVMDIAYSDEYKDYYYRIDGKRPAYNWGSTGLMEKPIQNYIEEVYYIRQMCPDIYIIGDVYSSPYLMREEYMGQGFLDGWYYYDTSAFYRHGWGDPAVDNYQADGRLLSFNRWNQMDRLFGSISKLAHSHGISYTAIVIPGTDNTCVHDFIGSPMYDGRTGTINTRANGLTYNRTWQAAIDADADHVCIVSWNELHEGTEIEPTIQNGTYYVELTSIWSQIFKQN